jgi:2-amino-4-hydroxy-6-hydroxymethyldihydropteridine diphosphokinase
MRYYLSLGSNLGNREQTLHEAVRRIGQQIGTVTRCSSFFYSEPWGFESTHPFCNLCCAVETAMQPMEVLAATQQIERELGRNHKSVNGKYSDRTIDIDIIRAFDDAQKEIVSSSTLLTIPHPHWKERDFVVIPLREIGGE